MVYGDGWLSPTDEVVEPKHQSTATARQTFEETIRTDIGTTMVFELSNITSGNTNWFTALARKAAAQFVRETCLTIEQITLKPKEAKEAKKNFIGGGH